MIASFKDFMNNIIVENLHPELQDVVNSANTRKTKQSQIAAKIKELTSRGESTGIEGNMPKGSSRAYMKHEAPHNIEVDGAPTTMRTGTKVAIKSPIEHFHSPHNFDDMSLGQLQNHAENGDHWINSSYRVLKHEEGNKFTSNHDSGIFPPLVNHDDLNHHWSHVGHVDNVSKSDFKKLTKTKEFPQGLEHGQFMASMKRFHERNHGKYWEGTNEKEIDKWDKHPLVQKFQDYHGNTGHPPYDLGQVKNMGVWTHPVDGTKHIVARDHGYSTTVSEAYQNAFKRRAGRL